jgi:hypothetical protein
MVRVSTVRDYYARSNTRTIKMLVAGQPGAGKTLLCSTFPGVLYADMEGRLLSVRNRDVHRTPISSVAELEELRAILAQDPKIRNSTLGFEVHSVVLDTVDELAKIVQRERLKAEHREALSMQDWGWYGDQMRNILRAYRNLGDLNVVFTVHLKPTEDSETGRVEYSPSIQGQVGNEVAGYVDEAFLLRSRLVVDPATGDRVPYRYMQCFPDPQYPWIKDHSGTMPIEFPVDFATDYERLSALIYGDLPSAGPALHLPPENAQVDLQVSEMPAEVPEAEPEPEAAAEPTSNGKAVPERPPLREDASGRPVVPAVVDVDLLSAEEPAVVGAPELTGVALETSEPAETKAAKPVRKKRTETTATAAPADSNEPRCAECGEIVGNADIAELAEILFGVPLCHPHFSAAQKKK